MKRWLLPVGAIAVILIGGFFILSFYLVKQIEPQFQSLLGSGFTATEIRVKPLYLSVEEVAYEDPHSKERFLEIEEVRVYPVLLSFLKPPLQIREITIHRPSFLFYRAQEGAFIGPWKTGGEEKGRRAIKDEKGEKGKPGALKIDQLRIRDATFYFKDMKTEGSPAQIELKELDLELKGIQYPLVSAPSSIELRGKIEGRTGNGNLDLEGWVDLKTMDMEAVLKIQGMDVTILEPYYRKRVSAKIDSGSIQLETRISVRQKRIDAPGRLELANLRVKGEGTVLWIPSKTLIALLEEKGGRIGAQFHLKGNMDDPEFSLHKTLLIQTAIALAEALGIPIKGLDEGLLKSVMEGEKGWIEELKGIEKRLKKKREKIR